MATHFQDFRRVFQTATTALLLGVLISCATKKGKSPPATKAASTHSAKKSGHAASPPSATSLPSPTPETSYVASVSVDGAPATQQTLTPDGQTVPAPQPATGAMPAPKPTPKPKANPLGLVTGTWGKIFHHKAAPTPTPGEMGQERISVSTSDGSSSDLAAHQGLDEESEAAPPPPAPIMVRTSPPEGYLTRMWHKIWPTKKEPPVAAPPEWLGTIKLINEREGYALIDAPASFALSTGETLNSVGPDSESGVLRVTADRNAPFFIADIVSGRPHAGDRVYSPKP